MRKREGSRKGGERSASPSERSRIKQSRPAQRETVRELMEEVSYGMESVAAERNPRVPLCAAAPEWVPAKAAGVIPDDESKEIDHTRACSPARLRVRSMSELERDNVFSHRRVYSAGDEPIELRPLTPTQVAVKQPKVSWLEWLMPLISSGSSRPPASSREGYCYLEIVGTVPIGPYPCLQDVHDSAHHLDLNQPIYWRNLDGVIHVSQKPFVDARYSTLKVLLYENSAGDLIGGHEITGWDIWVCSLTEEEFEKQLDVWDRHERDDLIVRAYDMRIAESVGARINAEEERTGRPVEVKREPVWQPLGDLRRPKPVEITRPEAAVEPAQALLSSGPVIPEEVKSQLSSGWSWFSKATTAVAGVVVTTAAVSGAGILSVGKDLATGLVDDVRAARKERLHRQRVQRFRVTVRVLTFMAKLKHRAQQARRDRVRRLWGRVKVATLALIAVRRMSSDAEATRWLLQKAEAARALREAEVARAHRVRLGWGRVRLVCRLISITQHLHRLAVQKQCFRQLKRAVVSQLKRQVTREVDIDLSRWLSEAERHLPVAEELVPVDRMVEDDAITVTTPTLSGSDIAESEIKNVHPKHVLAERKASYRGHIKIGFHLTSWSLYWVMVMVCVRQLVKRLLAKFWCWPVEPPDRTQEVSLVVDDGYHHCDIESPGLVLAFMSILQWNPSRSETGELVSGGSGASYYTRNPRTPPEASGTSASGADDRVSDPPSSLYSEGWDGVWTETSGGSDDSSSSLTFGLNHPRLYSRGRHANSGTPDASWSGIEDNETEDGNLSEQDSLSESILQSVTSSNGEEVGAVGGADHIGGGIVIASN